MPKGAPLSKIQATKNYGAGIVLEGDVFDDALPMDGTKQKTRFYFGAHL